MGGKTKTTTGPSAAALPNLNAATGALNSAYGQSSALASQGVNVLQSNLPTVLGQTLNNPTLSAANTYTQDVLGGKYLTGNPYLDQQIANTNASVTDSVNSAIGSRGLAGGSAQTQLLASQLAKNESNLRYTDYNNERSRMDSAVGNAAGLSSAGNQGIATLLAYLTGTAQLPQSVASQYANGVGGLWGNSTTTTQSKSPGLSDVVGLGLTAASLFSDRRLKRNVRRVGTRADGLGIYEYRYLWGGPVRRGVMADEVATIAPHALAAPVNGFARVDYGALR
ncbi:tail fiber domain-containing protein [Sphingomonas beigongshangi]|uniref:tail fiber domain-containing protein n=1 Tax=Sphingomonas beigongshangi TaxID=2782540 RepID=UPI00193B7AAC|nr:tail fiber domain-containing protein [Sphingomonas beigongshangi]